MPMEKPKTFTVCGIFMGRHISVPGHRLWIDAQQYACLKGWSEIRVIRG